MAAQQPQPPPPQAPQQMASQAIYCHYPHPHPHPHAAHAAAVQHQHAIYHQQQQYGTYATSMHHQQAPPPSMVGAQQNSIYQQIVPQAGALVQNGGHPSNPHSIYQPLVAVSQGSIYVSNLATMRRPTIQQGGTNSQHAAHLQHSHQQHHHQQTANAVPNIASSQQQQQQQIKSPQDVRNVSRSDSMETAIYEREKGVYKCSTLRQGGKFDPKYKPSILNCPLPEIPKDAEPPVVESIYQKQLHQQHQNYSKTLQRPPMKLPPQMKAIPPPRVLTLTTSPPNQPSDKITGLGKPQNALQSRTTTAVTTTTNPLTRDTKHSTNNDAVLPPPPSPVEGPDIVGSPPKLMSNINHNNNNNNNNSVSVNSNNTNNNNNNSTLSSNGITNHSIPDDDDLPPPPPPPALNDESNYAVTEL